MGLTPRTEYVRRGDGDIAFQVVGTGPVVLHVGGQASHLEQTWHFPFSVRDMERVAQVAQVIWYDVRGFGMSDRLPAGGYGVEEMGADALAVLDAVGIDRAPIWAEAFGGAVGIWLAVQHPERVQSLLLDNACASRRAHADYPIGLSEAEVAERRALFGALWGTGFSMAFWAPGMMDDERLKEEWARYEIVAATPRAVLEYYDVLMDLDVRDLLDRVTQPTLIVHSVSNGMIPVEHGRYLAEHIPHARYREFGTDTALLLRDDSFFADFSEFLTGTRARPLRRVLRVVLFVDIANSTDQAAGLGDRAWSALLDEFHNAIKTVLDRHDAEQVNTRGDDVLIVAASPSTAVEVAREIRGEAARLGVAVRSGLHLGEIERSNDDIAGIAVHIGARVADLATAGEILVSQTVRDALIGSDLQLSSTGTQTLKGVPGSWELFNVETWAGGARVVRSMGSKVPSRSLVEGRCSGCTHPGGRPFRSGSAQEK